MFIVVGFVGSEFEIFGGFGWVRSSVSASEPGFERVRSSTSRVRSSSKLEVFSKMFIVVGFVGSEFGIFVGFGWVRSSVLVGKLGFGRVRSSTSRIRSSSEFVNFGFDPTLVLCKDFDLFENSNCKTILCKDSLYTYFWAWQSFAFNL